MSAVACVVAPVVTIRTGLKRESKVNGAKNAHFAGARICAQPARFTLSAKTCPALATATAEKLGPDLYNKSYYPKAADHEQVNKPWYIVDAEGQTLGRLATLVAGHLRGSNLPTYTPSVDMGGYVVVINAEKVIVTGNKGSDKLYRRHTTGRPGKMKIETFDQLQARIPERIVEKAVKGMLPKGRLGRTLFTHLKVFEGAEHPHSAQQPVDITTQIVKKTVRISPLN
mmetsp:Transcript_7807/g.14777  ORF Transcript_7807/g.14777 Transcript_7807/m.14777 type:complete len:227 (-) Transcript_7807:222-902(-)